METQPEIQGAQSAAATATEAELIFTFAKRAPEVLLSFEGTAPPMGLFGDLQRLGWVVPSPPPPPSSAIDWTPDPTTGADYTLRPWRVEEFRLGAGSWPEPTEKEIGALTIQTLKHHRVVITNVRGLTEAEAAAARAPLAPTVRPQAAPAAATAPPAQAVAPAQAEAAPQAAEPTLAPETRQS